MKSLLVQGRQGVLSPAGVKAYRQNGLVVARDFFTLAETEAITAAVRAAAQRRGVNVFPAVDAQLAGEIKFDGQLQPKPSVQWDKANQDADVPPEVRAAAAAADAGEAVEWRHKEVKMTFKNQRQIDRAYRRLAKRRAQYGHYKASPRLTTDEEELAGVVDHKKLREAEGGYSRAQLKADFEAYKGSGKLEMDIRRENHINDTFAFINGWARCWTGLAATDAALRDGVVLGFAGRRVGEAAAALSGEVVVRLFSDSAYESYPFMNATPVFFGGAGGDYVSPTALGAMVGLTDSTGRGHNDAQRLVVLPGSHAVTLELTNQGADTTRFQMSSVFDFGKMLRLTPELKGYDVVQLPALEPGSVLFLNNFTFAGTLPTLAGSALSPYRPPAVRTVSNPYQYSLSLMPDRCVFTGERNSWASRDSHGPLYRYEKGQLLVDDDAFPVLHRALDIE